MRDFGLPHFLERFAFKNPKKLDYQPAVEGAAAAAAAAHKRYTSYGARGKPVKSLTKATCTEDEMFIFNYLEHKRKQAELVEQSKKVKEEEEAAEAEEGGDDDLKEGEVDDDEFESYLDDFFGNKAKKGGEDGADGDELNFLEELGGELQADKSKKKEKKKKGDDDDDDDDMADDWEDDAGDDDDDEELSEAGEQSDDETGSIDLQPLDGDDDEDDDDEEGSISMDGGDSDTSDAPESPDEDDDDDDEDAPKSKKARKETQLNERSFANKLKHSNGAYE